MSNLNILAVVPIGIKKWAKPFTSAVLGTLKQIAGVPFQSQFAFVSEKISEEELEKIKDQIIRTDIFVFILSPEYVEFEQAKGLLQLVKARENVLKPEHKIVFSILRETCKMPPYFLQKPLFDFIGEAFNTQSFKGKYVKLVKDVVAAMKASDKMNSIKSETTSSTEAEAIPISTEPESPIPVASQTPEFVSPANVPESPAVTEEIIEEKSVETNEQPIEEPLAKEKAEETDEELEDVDFLEPFNNDPVPTADGIPSVPEVNVEKPAQEQEQEKIEDVPQEKSNSEDDWGDGDHTFESETPEQKTEEISINPDIPTNTIEAQNDILEEKINSDLDMSAEDDILAENLDEPNREEVTVEQQNPVNELNTNDNWDSFLGEEKNAEIVTQNDASLEEEEELKPWTGSARAYDDPDIKKKKTQSFSKKKAKTDSVKKGMKPKTRKVNSKRRKRRKMETDADLISGEISNDGFDVLDELGIDLDKIPEDTATVETKKKSDTSIFEELSDQQDLSLDDDLSFDNELVLEDLEDESIEDDNVGAEYGMSKITLTDDADESKPKTEKLEKDVIDELDLGDDIDKMDIPKGNCTVFMNKVPESRYEEAIRMIHEINGLPESEIETLLGRIVVPVLKDVFEEEAEKALDKIKRSGFNGRIRKT